MRKNKLLLKQSVPIPRKPKIKNFSNS